MHKPVSHAWQGPESSFAFILPSFVHQPYRATRNGCLQMDPDGVIGALLININKVETSSFWAARRETDPHDPSHTLDVTHSTCGQIHQHREVTVRHLQIAPKLHRWMDSWLPLLLLGPDCELSQKEIKASIFFPFGEQSHLFKTGPARFSISCIAFYPLFLSLRFSSQTAP
ncbi:hypothetical protein BDDG_02919 [Blastomyces dermatitidis ATCC 18188]|uniref:Uncharacterized protein n=1 Tax=Ajellomyces dermatitidis (strain ATCC 18188 / CBS 674.68) TaxID=653446 RepID=F2T9R5_AJEDA|nr:hypothetical protein BDDG_02919 [Blastomyces dermatitidis ATCC 18188]